MTDPARGSDPLHGASRPETYWSTTNAAEAMPGVQTPLCWSVWSRVCELGMRGAFADIGALPRREVVMPADTRDRVYNIFFGRVSLQVDFIFRMGNLMPGTSGAAAVTQWLDYLPPGLTDTGTRRRYPIIAVRMPLMFLSIPRRTYQVQQEVDSWYRPALARIPALDLAGARKAFIDAVEHLDLAMGGQVRTVLLGVQPVFDQLERLVRSGGGPTTELLRGYGSHEETHLVADIWACSRGRLDIEEFLARHGYHGPHAGEVSSVVWREDPTAVHSLMEQYRRQPDSADPAVTADHQVAERIRLERRLIAGLPRLRRPAARLVLALAHRYLPLRAKGKMAFLQSLDVVRCAARRYGEHLAAAGHLDRGDDVFFLTSEEVRAGLTEGLRDVIDVRRERYATYRTLDIPSAWQGYPDPEPVEGVPDTDPTRTTVTGTGSSPGVVEGTVRVVTDPLAETIDEGDILVARFTDPSWASVMFLASALVVDIGGLLSHAAVVARELGVPCVMGTGIGTRALKTGDRCRVDGNAGTVEILERRAEPAAQLSQLST